MRLNELLDLRLGDIDFANGRIFICNPKGGHDRVAFMTPSLAHSLHLYIVQRPAGADDHLWCHNGRLLADEAVREQLARWGQLCGVKVTPHQLRHTFATQLVNHGLPIDSVRKLLGHQTLNMTQHYARMFDATIRSGRSMSASALKEGAGARSQVTNLVTWVVTIITLLFLTPLFAPLPEAGVYRRLTANWHAPGRARARYPQCDGAGHGAAQCGAAFAAIL